jgi:hypothetical protein
MLPVNFIETIKFNQLHVTDGKLTIYPSRFINLTFEGVLHQQIELAINYARYGGRILMVVDDNICVQSVKNLFRIIEHSKIMVDINFIWGPTGILKK